MKKITNYLVSGALGLLVAQTSFASDYDKTNVSGHCRSIGHQLESLALQRHNDACSQDVEIAAAYLAAASIKINHNKYDDALMSLNQSKQELYNISYTKSYCSYYVPFTKKYFAELIQIISEVEVLERIKA